MTQWLKQSTAVTLKVGPFVDATDAVTPETALTITQSEVRLSKGAGDIAQKSEATSATHDEGGWYDIPIDATDTNTLGRLMLSVQEAGALPVWQEFMVVPGNVWDSFFGADALQVHANEITAGLITATAIATGAIDADAIAADAITAAKVADGTIDAATFAAGAIDAAAIAADAITAAKVAADVSAEIADAVWDEDIDAAHQTVNTAGKRLDDSSTTISANLDAVISGLNNLSAAQVNAEVVDALATDMAGEPGTGAPPLSASIQDKIAYLYKFMRNRVTSTATTITVFNDDASTAGQVSTHSDDSTTYDRGEFGSG